MKAIWKLEPCTAPDIREDLQASKGWTYSTVRTLMDRMVRKGLLSSKKIRHIDLYSSTVSPQQARKADLMRTLKNAFNDAMTPMFECLLDARQIDDTQLDELESLLRKKRRSSSKNKP